MRYTSGMNDRNIPAGESRPRRGRVLLWLTGGALVLLILSGVLGAFDLQPGRIFLMPTQAPTAESQSEQDALGQGNDSTLETILRGILAIAWILLPVSLIVSMLSRQGRRRLLTNVVTIIMLLIILYRIQEIEPAAKSQSAAGQVGGDLGAVAGEPLPPAPPAPPDWLAWAASAGIVLVLGGLAYYFGRRMLFSREESALVQIGDEAEKARRELDQGGAVEDVVVRCYRQMSRIVAEARALRRQTSDTPEEFARVLVEAGLPPGPLGALTRLFEDVRYGSIPAGPTERQAAIDSLAAIAAACRSEHPLRGQEKAHA
jgi:hypothetical protein